MLPRSATNAALAVLLASILALPAIARTRPHYGGTLRIETQSDPWQIPDGLARRLVLDTLTALDDSGNAQPALALRWEAQNAAHRWEFQLRPNVRFHDNAPLTAESTVTALDQVCAAPNANCPWRAVHAVGSAVIFTADNSTPDLPELLAQTEFAIARHDASGTYDGTGPFRVTGFANGALTLAANDDCWQGRPFLDSIEIYPHRSIRDQWLDLSVGRADVVEVPPEMLRQAEQQHLAVLVSRPVDLLSLAVTPQGPLASLQMRQSIALAVDRASISNVIFQKQGEVTASLLPAALSGYSFLFPANLDLDRARTLRGGASTAPLTLATEDTSAAMQLAAERIALNLHEAGFTVLATPGAHPPAPLVLRRDHLEAASPRAALDELLARFGQNGTVTGTDPAALYQSEQAALVNGAIVPLLWLPREWAAGERVRDLRLSPDGIPLLAGASLEGAP
jgi:MarR-like DNA-binding transcriptional regulator SgrR of sgrS sRNA